MQIIRPHPAAKARTPALKDHAFHSLCAVRKLLPESGLKAMRWLLPREHLRVAALH